MRSGERMKGELSHLSASTRPKDASMTSDDQQIRETYAKEYRVGT